MLIDNNGLTLTAAGNAATNVSVAAPIELTFSDAIMAGSGTITITDGYSQSVMGRDGQMYTRIVGATDTRVIAISDSQVSVSGTKLVVSLNDMLHTNTTYRVLLSQGAVLDSSEHSFGGVLDTTQFSFSTSATVPAGPTATVNSAISLSNDDGYLNNDFYVGTASQTISGTFSGTLGSNSIEVSVDGGSTWHTATVSGSSWSYAATLISGNHDIIARVTDGTAHSTERSKNYTLDTAAPTATPVSGFTLDLAAGCDSGVSDTDNLTNETTPTIRVNVSSSVHGLRVGDTIELVDSNHGDAVLGYYTIHASDINYYGELTDGYVDINVATSLSDGAHAIKARIGDLAGHTPTAAGPALDITVDMDAAAVSSATPTDHASNVGTNLAKITLTFDDDVYVRASTTFTLVATDNSDTREFNGEELPANYHYNSVTHKLDIFIDGSSLHPSTEYVLRSVSGLVDAAGNEVWNANDEVMRFTTTTTGAIVASPTLGITDNGISATDGITSNDEVNVGITAGSTWRYSTDGGATWHWELDGDTTFGLADGSYAVGQIRIQQVTANNQYSAVISNTQVITVDTAAPSATIDYSGIDSFFGTGVPVHVGNIALSGTVSGAQVQYSLDHGATWDVATPNAGHDLWAFDATIAHGGYVALRVADAAGNQADDTGISGLDGAYVVYVGDGYGSSDFTTASGTVLFANGGDDTVSTVSGNFTYLDGGSGEDTLQLNGSGTVDVADWVGKLKNFEHIELGASATLDLRDTAAVKTLVGSGELFIDGSATSQVNLGTGIWSLDTSELHLGYVALHAADGAEVNLSIGIIGILGGWLGGV